MKNWDLCLIVDLLLLLLPSSSNFITMSRLNFRQFPLRNGRFPLKEEKDQSFSRRANFKTLPLNNGRTVFRFNMSQGQVCRTFRFQQTIKHRGCEDRVITNRGCYGFCNSIMHIGKEKGLDLKIIQTCVNDRTKFRPVRLKCPGRKKGYKLKSVLVVKSCKCRRSIPIMRRSVQLEQQVEEKPEETNVK
jgi:DAN domain.